MLRQLTSDFLRQRRQQEIDALYERAYAAVEEPLGKEFEGWEEEGVWPPIEPGRDLDGFEREKADSRPVS